MPKHVVFVLDTSGSMEGKKMHQTQSAMRTILAELRQGEDYMSIVSFSDETSTWRRDGRLGVTVDKESVKAAEEHVAALKAEGNYVCFNVVRIDRPYIVVYLFYSYVLFRRRYDARSRRAGGNESEPAPHLHNCLELGCLWNKVARAS